MVMAAKTKYKTSPAKLTGRGGRSRAAAAFGGAYRFVVTLCKRSSVSVRICCSIASCGVDFGNRFKVSRLQGAAPATGQELPVADDPSERRVSGVQSDDAKDSNGSGTAPQDPDSCVSNATGSGPRANPESVESRCRGGSLAPRLHASCADPPGRAAPGRSCSPQRASRAPSPTLTRALEPWSANPAGFVRPQPEPVPLDKTTARPASSRRHRSQSVAMPCTRA